MSNPKTKVMMAMRDNGLSAILFRNAMARKLGLNVAEAACLSLLGIKGISSPKELAYYTGLTSGSTTSMLDRLEKRGFIHRKPNPHDRRGVLIEIDAAYPGQAQEFITDLQTAHFEMMRDYSDDQLDIIADFLIRFTRNVEAQTSKMESGEGF